MIGTKEVRLMTDELMEQRIATINAQKRYRDRLKIKAALAAANAPAQIMKLRPSGEGREDHESE